LCNAVSQPTINHWHTGKAASCVGLSDGSCFGEALLLTNEARRRSPCSIARTLQLRSLAQGSASPPSWAEPLRGKKHSAEQWIEPCRDLG
jgi:hypothetical protein